MKSLPEKEFWKTISSRLRDHSEEPDDDWNVIAAAIGSKKKSWIDLAGHGLSAVSLLIFLFLFQVGATSNTDDSATLKIFQHDSRAGGNSVEDSTMQQHALVEGTKRHLNEDEEQRSSRSVNRSKDAITTRVNTTFAKTISSSDQANESVHIGLIVDPSNASESMFAGKGQGSTAMEKGSFLPKSDFDSALLPSTEGTHQENVVQRRQEKKKVLGLSSFYFTVTPTLSYFKIIPEKEDQLVITRIQRDGLMSSNRLGYQLEAGFQQSLTPKIDFFFGAQWCSFNENLTYDHLSGQVDQVQTEKNNYIITPATTSTSTHHSIKQAGFNTGVFYSLKQGRLSHRAGVGFTFAKSVAKYSVEGYDRRSNSNSLSYFLAYRMQYALSRKVEWFVQPTFSYSLKSNQIDDEPFKVRPYRVGVSFGLFYKF